MLPSHAQSVSRTQLGNSLLAPHRHTEDGGLEKMGKIVTTHEADEATEAGSSREPQSQLLILGSRWEKRRKNETDSLLALPGHIQSRCGSVFLSRAYNPPPDPHTTPPPLLFYDIIIL